MRGPSPAGSNSVTVWAPRGREFRNHLAETSEFAEWRRAHAPADVQGCAGPGARCERSREVIIKCFCVFTAVKATIKELNMVEETVKVADAAGDAQTKAGIDCG